MLEESKLQFIVGMDRNIEGRGLSQRGSSVIIVPSRLQRYI